MSGYGKPEQLHKRGDMESAKFDYRREKYRKGVEEILGMGFPAIDLLHYFPSFVGHMTLCRYLALYELYKQTLGISGHIAEIGVYKGATALLFAKLIKIFEPESLTMVHGFDWFKGYPEEHTEEPLYVQGSYLVSEERIRKLIAAQGFDNILQLHAIDVTKEFDAFFERNPHMCFKIAFIDAGIYEVVKEGIRQLWPRLTPGGILILDQFNTEYSRGETQAVRELLPGLRIETVPFSWMPTAFIRKPSGG